MIRSSACILVPLALSLLALQALADPLPARLFAQHPQYSPVAMSPDGRHLAITTPVDNRTDLMIIDIDGKSEPRRVRYRPDEHVIEPWWASDDRRVIGKGKKSRLSGTALFARRVVFDQPGDEGTAHAVRLRTR
jgi:hypothetical protein